MPEDLKAPSKVTRNMTPFAKVQPPRPAFLTKEYVAPPPCEHVWGVMVDAMDNDVGLFCHLCPVRRWRHR